MPKRVYKINNFHGGLNNSSDPRDVDDKEVTESINAMVDEVGRVRLSGSNATHSAQVLDNTGAGVTQVPGSGLFYFSHDRKGGEDAGDDENETGDNYLALYDDSDAQVWVYSESVADWDDDKDSSNNGVINFLGKTTGSLARPCFFSVDGSVRISSGEFRGYDSGTDTNEPISVGETDGISYADGDNLIVGNYIQINDEIMYVKSVNTGADTIDVIKGIFGTKEVEHDNDQQVNLVNMNQWYGYINNKLFQTSRGSSVYENNKWYNNIQHLRSLDELGITLALHDATSNSPTASEINVVNKIVVAYWFTTTEKDVGFWNGTYWIGLTPIYEGGQEGPISTVGSSPLVINEEILNVQLYISHPSLTSTSITTHPLLDERITGLKLYTKNYTSDEWFLLKEFDLLEGGEHGWDTYNSVAGAEVNIGDGSNGNTLTGFWKTTSTADSLSVAAPSATESYDGKAENNTCTVTLDLEQSKGADRVGVIRLSGFDNSPLYKEVDLSSTSSQAKAFDVVNPAPGTHKFVAHLLDENFNIMARAELQQAISDSGVDSSPASSSVSNSGSS
tara:strand:+ start:443 stop:2128 length:1686 start_codon:yes stop_codon:yes gene_type:complete